MACTTRAIAAAGKAPAQIKRTSLTASPAMIVAPKPPAPISAANVAQQSQSGELARRARDWLLQYRTALGLPDPEKASGGQAAGTVVQWDGDGHRRGRFSSLGY